MSSYLAPDGHFQLKITITFSPRKPDVSGINYKKFTGYISLRNQGATCYANSAPQCLFHFPAFRHVVFNRETEGTEDASGSVPLNLQRLFCLIQRSPITLRTIHLTRAMGSSFFLSLIDFLEESLKGTEH
jgi:ubiquitin carboxyl-terminal hydrolase 7